MCSILLYPFEIKMFLKSAHKEALPDKACHLAAENGTRLTHAGSRVGSIATGAQLGQRSGSEGSVLQQGTASGRIGGCRIGGHRCRRSRQTSVLMSDGSGGGSSRRSGRVHTVRRVWVVRNRRMSAMTRGRVRMRIRVRKRVRVWR